MLKDSDSALLPLKLIERRRLMERVAMLKVLWRVIACPWLAIQAMLVQTSIISSLAPDFPRHPATSQRSHDSRALLRCRWNRS
jgi:hypothetical protein